MQFRTLFSYLDLLLSEAGLFHIELWYKRFAQNKPRVIISSFLHFWSNICFGFDELVARPMVHGGSYSLVHNPINDNYKTLWFTYSSMIDTYCLYKSYTYIHTIYSCFEFCIQQRNLISDPRPWWWVQLFSTCPRNFELIQLLNMYCFLSYLLL